MEAEKTVVIDVDKESGVFSVEGALFLGERVNILFNGVKGTPRISVFADCDKEVLADNVDQDGILDLRWKTLRSQFDTHSSRTFKALVYGGDDDVYAEGRVTIRWSPIIFERDGTPTTTEGPQGRIGPMGPISQVTDPVTNKWYNVYARLNEDGERVLVMEQEPTDPRNGGMVALSSELDETNKAVEELREKGIFDSAQLFDIEFFDGNKKKATTNAYVMKGGALASVGMPDVLRAFELEFPGFDSGFSHGIKDVYSMVKFNNGENVAPCSGYIWLAFSYELKPSTWAVVDIGYIEDGFQGNGKLFNAVYPINEGKEWHSVWSDETTDNTAYSFFFAVSKGSSVRLRTTVTESQSNKKICRFIPCLAEI